VLTDTGDFAWQIQRANLWQYGGLRLDQAKKLKELEKENTRLKKLLAEAELDKAILKEAASGN
jgi:putative transposase